MQPVLSLLYGSSPRLSDSDPTTYSTKELLSALKPLFDAVKDLKPYKDGEAKSIWVVVPRGDISDYGDYEEWKEYGDVSSFEEFESLWKEEYPTESVWYELFLSEGEDYR